MKKEKLIPWIISFIIILECLGIIIINFAKIENFEIGFGDSIGVIFFTFFSYMFIIAIYCNKYKVEYIEWIMIPIHTWMATIVCLGLILEIIPNFMDIFFLGKIYIISITVLILRPTYEYIKQRIRNMREITQIEKIYKNNIEEMSYYREILAEYSPAVLSFCYNRKINYQDTLVATIINLKMKNIIQIEDKGISILKTDIQNINSNEKYILSEITSKTDLKFIKYEILKSIFSDKKFKKKWKETIRLEAQENGLYLSRKLNLNFLDKAIDKIGTCLILMPVIIGIIDRDDYTESQDLAAFVVSIILNIWIILGWFTVMEERIKENMFIKTHKGVEIQSKLAGLKNYIKDYSDLENRNINEVILWEDYLIYAIIFNLKGKLDKDATKLYNKLISSDKKLINF